MASIPAGPQPGAGFNAAAWLAEWAEHGGIVLLVEDRLYLRRSPSLGREATAQLDRLRAIMFHRAGGLAIADELSRRREGRVQ